MSRLRPGMRPPWVIAHRGASRVLPENTLAAFDEALDQGADGIELDVQLSADGVPFLYHDRTLAKLGAGRRRVESLPSSVLAGLDAGSWFDPSIRDQRLPTLAEVLERFARRTTLLVEMKVRDRDRSSGRHEALARAVASTLRERRLDGRVLVLCFDLEALRIASRVAPGLRTVWNLRAPRRVTPRLRETMETVRALSVDVRTLTPPLVSAAHELGLPVMSFTCNTVATVRRARRCEVDAIMSDRPDWLRRELARTPAR